MSKKNNLKEKNLYIDNDLTKKEKKIQKSIADFAREKRKRRVRVKIGYKKTRINGKDYRWKEGAGLEQINFWYRQSAIQTAEL